MVCAFPEKILTDILLALRAKVKVGVVLLEFEELAKRCLRKPARLRLF